MLLAVVAAAVVAVAELGTPGAGKSGVIGRMLTEDERFDLIEYLKTL